MLRTLLTTSFPLSFVVPTFGQAPARPAKPFTLTQVWTFDATYTDQQHGVTFRYPSVWQAGTGFGYHPPALTARSDEKQLQDLDTGRAASRVIASSAHIPQRTSKASALFTRLFRWLTLPNVRP